MHYQRWKKYGDPEHREVVCTKSLEEALAIRAEWDGECYVWTGAKSEDGYAMYAGHESKIHGTRFLHRIMWEREHGPIPDGLEIDHMCFTRNCIRVDHLRLADRSLNTSNLAGLKANNKTGIRGVHWVERDQKYVALVKYKKKAYYVGGFKDIEKAAEAIEKARAEIYGQDLAA